MKILWFVTHGPDASHMWDSKPFERLKDARTFVNELPLTPFGHKRSFKIERFEYVKDKIYGDIVRIHKY